MRKKQEHAWSADLKFWGDGRDVINQSMVIRYTREERKSSI